MHRYIRATVRTLEIDTSHFVGQAWSRGRTFDDALPRRRIPLEEVLVKNSTYRSSPLRQRLIKAGLKENRCERCGLDSWMGEPLTLALDHVNGDATDNRLENLRILCPNCHAQTDTWCVKNRKSPA